MTVQLSVGKTWHTRMKPVEHSFTYPLISVCLELTDWGAPHSKLFSFDRWNVFSLHSKEFLSKGDTSLYQKVVAELRNHKYEKKITRVVLHTAPRFLGFVFNPVNFYYCYTEKGLSVVLVEINNTFGEKHTYTVPITGAGKYRVPKQFHVSPFNPVDGYYHFVFEEQSDQYRIEVNLERESEIVFKSGFTVVPHVLNTPRLLLTAVTYPMTLIGTTLRIGLQAFKLYFVRKLPVFSKPEPQSSHTQKWGKPVLIQRLFTGDYLENIHELIIKIKGKKV
jgi:DUF1365 family protein